MIRYVRTSADVDTIRGIYPTDVIAECERLAKIYDECYNCKGIDGGYVVIVENDADMIEVQNTCVDYTAMPYEAVDVIGAYVSVLYIVGTEYAIDVIMPVDVFHSRVAERR